MKKTKSLLTLIICLMLLLVHLPTFVSADDQPLSSVTYYVDTSYNSGTPGWHVTHWNKIHEAVQNCTNSANDYMVLVNGDGDVYNENVLVSTAEAYITLHIIGNYTTTKPRVNGQDTYKSTFELMNDRILISGFTVYNNIGKPANYHGIAVGKTLMDLTDQNNITILNCYITQATDGILLRGQDFNISNNEIDSTSEGIWSLGPSGGDRKTFNIFYNNYIHSCQDGITTYLSCNNTIIRNTISSSTLDGIYLQVSSDYNTIYYNNVSNSGSSGIRIFYSASNIIYNNNLINNNPTVSGTSTNYWSKSYPICGNYYSSVSGTDVYSGPSQNIPGSDDIRDTSYTIATNNIDYYPFLHAFNGTYPIGGVDNPPDKPTCVSPIDNTTDVPISNTRLECHVTDSDNDNMTVTFYWGNGSQINSLGNIPSDSDVLSQKLTGLPYSTKYYWYVNANDSLLNTTSDVFAFTTESEPINYPPAFSTPSPTNGSMGQSINTSSVSISVTDLEWDTFNISIHGDYLINVSLNGQTNGTFSANLTVPLPYDTDIWWYVDVQDSLGRWVNASYYFYTRVSGNRAPSAINENPVNNSNYVLVNSYLSLTAIDLDYDVMNVSFHWGNGTEIGTDLGVSNGSTANIYLPYHVLMSHDTAYMWYANVTDGIINTTSPTWTFRTCRSYDLNGDDTVNYLDISSLVSHYGGTVSPSGSQPWDINSDGATNYLDISSLVSHYGESY